MILAPRVVMGLCLVGLFLCSDLLYRYVREVLTERFRRSAEMETPAPAVPGILVRPALPFPVHPEALLERALLVRPLPHPGMRNPLPQQRARRPAATHLNDALVHLSETQLRMSELRRRLAAPAQVRESLDRHEAHRQNPEERRRP
ncbi:MAG: hypothetical protein D6746_06835 [Bacteroidetes bacterium]|nr:MAG: hypothetical protein D6746_06835 [Bacteroidota bacterium]